MVSVSLYGQGTYIDIFSESSFTSQIFDDKVKKRQSFTIVQIENSKNPKKYRSNAVGERQPGDKLIYFQSQNVTNTAKFSEAEFIFLGKTQQAITYVGFSFDVSDLIYM